MQVGGPLYERTERDRDMNISGFVDLDEADALDYVKTLSEGPYSLRSEGP